MSYDSFVDGKTLNKIDDRPTVDGVELTLLSQVLNLIQKKSNLHYTRRITPKRVTSSGAHLRGLPPGQHSSEESSQRWRVVGDIADLTGPEFKPQTSRTDSVRLATELSAVASLKSKVGRPDQPIFEDALIELKKSLQDDSLKSVDFLIELLQLIRLAQIDGDIPI